MLYQKLTPKPNRRYSMLKRAWNWSILNNEALVAAALTLALLALCAAMVGCAPAPFDPISTVEPMTEPTCDVAYLTAVNGCENARFEQALSDTSARRDHLLGQLNDCRYRARLELGQCAEDPYVLCGASCEHDYRESEIEIASGREVASDFAAQTRATYRICLASCEGETL